MPPKQKKKTIAEPDVGTDSEPESNQKSMRSVTVNFIHGMDNQMLMIQGEIAHDKIFKVPKTKGTKFLKDSQIETKSSAPDQPMVSISNQLTSLNAILLKNNEDNKELRSLLQEYLSPNNSRCNSPSISRKTTINNNEIEEESYLQNGNKSKI
ncbi:unnamed protein product [Brachionus calyciflorus]|uniref:Uncharacterized protein n=1 Tax=Brachionus calyciflorus TaxID=104777 RepID=A0A814NSX0_9BILA|nr:unnamed protein product [Brachionus calyciflorus]